MLNPLALPDVHGRIPGDVRLGDARDALSQLASERKFFAAIVVDIADTGLDRADVEHLHLGCGEYQ